MKRALCISFALAAAAAVACAGGTARALPPVVQPLQIYTVVPQGGATGKGALFRLDAGGNPTLVTDFGANSKIPGVKHEPNARLPISVAVEQDGTILVLDR